MAKATEVQMWDVGARVRSLTRDPLGLTAIVFVVAGLAVFVIFPVTRVLATPGLASAALLVGIYTLSDFGNPMLVGGSFKVLATETYTQITGWGDIGMTAALRSALLLPSLILFVLQRYWVEGRSYAAITGKGSFADPAPNIAGRALESIHGLRRGGPGARGRLRRGVRGRFCPDLGCELAADFRELRVHRLPG
jgi:hypothetical protein